jgi:hypothetical protein
MRRFGRRRRRHGRLEKVGDLLELGELLHAVGSLLLWPLRLVAKVFSIFN